VPTPILRVRETDSAERAACGGRRRLRLGELLLVHGVPLVGPGAGVPRVAADATGPGQAAALDAIADDAARRNAGVPGRALLHLGDGRLRTVQVPFD
jgi:hypothetical protein